MKYLYDYNRSPSYLVGGLRDLFYEELENKKFEIIKLKSNGYVIEFEYLLCKINDYRFMLHEILSYRLENNQIFVVVEHLNKKEVIKINVENFENVEKLIDILNIVIDSKEISLRKYHDLQDKINNEMTYYKLKFKFENEEIYYKLHGEIQNLDDEELVESIKILKENEDLYFVLKNEKILIPDLDCRKLKSIDINNIYCSNVYLTPTDEDFIIIAEFLLYL